MFSNRSLCELRKATCGRRVVPVDNQFCSSTEKCNADCTKYTGQFVCGSDLKLYRSDCEMRKNNCG